GATNDLLFNGIGSYMGDVQGILNANKSYNYLSYSDRPKIEMLTYAQRSDYQCEVINVPTSDIGVDWWYAFDFADGTGEDIQDGDAIVRYCEKNNNNHPEGIVVKDLRANREQTDNRKRGFWDGNYDWYIKPSIKINIADATHDKKVCNIIVRRWDGQPIVNADIYGDYFKNDPGWVYLGGYKEEFLFPENNNLLKIDNSGANYPNGNLFNPTNTSSGNCFMDIEVYWYKECDMWIDYIRVENEWADRLFKDYYDDPVHPERQWIEWEANQIPPPNTTYNFYTDELEYNMMPAIKYLNEHIYPYNSALSVNSVVNITFYSPELRSNSYTGWNRADISEDHIAANIAKWKMNEIMVDIYPMFGTKISELWFGLPQYLPQSLLGNNQYDPSKGILGYPAPEQIYERNLDSVINRLYIPGLKKAKNV
ncbi:MAG: hypothetical protein NTU73_04800, partial [Ignavibacteriae bacterium]|nr:hypothetical protein [Ignavibacteriota bacterium]